MSLLFALEGVLGRVKTPLPFLAVCLIFSVHFPASLAAADGPFDPQRIRELFRRMQAGEKLTEGERRQLEEARRMRESDGFDWQKAKAAHEKERRGEQLTDEEKQYLDAAKKRISEGRGPGGQSPASPPAPPKDLVPLTELTGKYRDQGGGLYGGGRNEPPEAHSALARRAMAEMKPLDRDGRPAADGKIVLMSIGMSNTTQEFGMFVPMAHADARKAPHVFVVDAAQGGKDADAWAAADAQPWTVAEQRLHNAGTSPAQVQAIWIKQALKGPREGFPAETQRLRDRLRDIVTVARRKYPNLRIAYLSSRIYAGYATTVLNPEPYAYESAFAVRWLIDEQIRGAGELNADPAKGDVKAPVLLWGPYLWANGEVPRNDGALSYSRADLAGDGTHPSKSGQEKVARLLLDFFTTDPLARGWFVK